MDLPGYLRAVRRLARDADALVGDLDLPAGQRALNVHAYALPAYEAFLERYYAEAHPPVAAIPMNPGKNGAVQTGIPFTDVARARELLPGFDGLVRSRGLGLPKPAREQSGRRVYGWGVRRFGSPGAFLANLLVCLPCPLAVLEQRGGRVTNVPLEALPRGENARCMALITRHAPALLRAAEPRAVLLMGKYAEGVWAALEAGGTAPEVPVAACLHPAAHVNDADWMASADQAWDALFPPVARGAGGPGPQARRARHQGPP